MRLFPILGLAVWAGCAPGLKDEAFPTGSQTAVGSTDHTAVYVVDADAGALQRVDVSTGAITSVALGGEPSRVARAGDRVYVTLPDQRAVVLLEDHDGVLSVVETTTVGAEPVGIVAREDGKSVYVAVSTADQVVELDGRSLEVVRGFDVPGQPRWLALHPVGKTLYVGSAFGADLHWIDLDSGVVETLPLPAIHRGVEDPVALSRRVTGDLWISADGERLAVPALFADNTTAVSDPLGGEEGPNVTPTPSEDTGSISSGYGSVGLSLSRFNPGVVLVPTGERSGLPHPEDQFAVFVAGFSTVDGREGTPVRSYLSSVAIAPAGDLMFATMEASSTVVAMSTTPVVPDASLCEFCEVDSGGGSISDAGMSLAASVFIGTEAGPRGVAFTGDNAWTHTFLDRTLTPLDPARAREGVQSQVENGFSTTASFWAATGHDLGPDGLESDVSAGRRLFFSATDSKMAGSGAGVSCSTCHAQGRNDGLTWTFSDGLRQTPSLSAPVSLTTPVTWTDNVPSVADEATITSQGRMGGAGLTARDAAHIQAFVDSLRQPDVPLRGEEDAAIARGRALFERADTACSTCHSGAQFTDNDHHDIYGLTGVNTPTLVGIAATAPYLHDGTMATIRDVLELSRSGAMGDTSALTDAEMDDLDAFVRSL